MNRLVKFIAAIVLIGIPEHKIVSVLDSYFGMNIVDYVQN